jgi:hypothetical protein
MDVAEPGRRSMSDAGARAVPSVDDVEAIGACPAPILRNLRITQAYHELTTATAAMLGSGANWCTFATWASKQAGQTIRAEDLGRKIEATFATSEAVHVVVARIRDVRRAAGRAVEATTVLSALRDACAPLLSTARVADAVARGNKKVFDEIGAEFARFVPILRTRGDDAAVEAFLARLRPGDPPEGQRLLAGAFRDYHRARRLIDPKTRAQLMFFANVRIGLHEQTRLQPEIAAALNAPIPDPVAVGRRLSETLFSGRLARGARSPRMLAEVSGRLLEPLRAVVRRIVTEELMMFALPEGRTLRLGTDLTGSFPEHLAKLDDPEAVAFLTTVDPTLDSLRGSGAEDWADLADRMHMILDLFRQQHENAALFQPPFTAEQLQAMAGGGTPDGNL